MDYRVTFTRVGRNEHVGPVTITVSEPDVPAEEPPSNEVLDEIARSVHALITGKKGGPSLLRSTEVVVYTERDFGGTIIAGDRPAGAFCFERLPR